MEELDLKELFKMFWSKKVQILIIVLLFAVIGVIYTAYFVTPMYSSSTTLVLASSNNSASTDASITTTDLSINSKLVSTYSELVKSKNVLRQVIYNLKIDIDEETLRKNITVSSVKNTELIEITVTNENKYYAKKLANEIANVFMDKIKGIYNIENVQVVDKAETPSTPSNVNHVRDVAIFVLVGLVVSVIYVLLDNILDNTVKTAEELESMYHMPVLASVPQYAEEEPRKKGGRK